jgi:hypothetical protein
MQVRMPRIPWFVQQPSGGVVYQSDSRWFLTDSNGKTYGPYAGSDEPIRALLASETVGLIQFPRHYPTRAQSSSFTQAAGYAHVVDSSKP